MRARTSGDAKPGEVKPGHDDPRVLARRLLPSALHSSALMNESHAHTHAETNRSSTCHITIVLPRTISPPGSARSPPTTASPPARCVTPGRTLVVVVRVVGFSAAETDETFNDESASPSRWPRTFSAYASGLRRLPACISVSVDRGTSISRRGIVIARVDSPATSAATGTHRGSFRGSRSAISSDFRRTPPVLIREIGSSSRSAELPISAHSSQRKDIRADV